MKIFIDIGHPAHVHYFRNFIRIMQGRGHNFFITARQRECVFDLLGSCGLHYHNRGPGSTTLAGKLLYLLQADFALYRLARHYLPDLFLSFGSAYAAHAAWLLRKPHIAFDDTEHATLEHLLSVPFTDAVLTPSCFRKTFGKKQIRFNGYMELCYLHPNYFTPDPAILDMLGVRSGEKYVILRFVSWSAAHDVGHAGIALEMKRRAAKELSRYARVFISSEKELPPDLQQYRICIPPERMHDALFYAVLLYGESATMASECAVLGTPAVFIDDIGRGYTDEEEREYGLVFNYSESQVDQAASLQKALELVKADTVKDSLRKKRFRILSEKIDVTAFMVWLIDQYPKSLAEINSNVDWERKFK